MHTASHDASAPISKTYHMSIIYLKPSLVVSQTVTKVVSKESKDDVVLRTADCWTGRSLARQLEKMGNWLSFRVGGNAGDAMRSLAMGSAGIAASAGCCARRAAFAAAAFAAALRATWRLTRVFVVSLRGGSLNFIHGSRLSYSNQS